MHLRDLDSEDFQRVRASNLNLQQNADCNKKEEMKWEWSKCIAALGML